MNMASIVIILFVIAVICISAGNSAFVNLQCKTKNFGQYGQESLLECVVRTSRDVDTKTQIRVVTWKKEGVDEPLLVFYKGKTIHQLGYSFAEPSWTDENMNVSLLITNTAVKDDGVYTCEVVTNSGDSGDEPSRTSLKVTAKYNVPTIISYPEKITRDTGGVLLCNSDGGYPEGQLRWFDIDNNEWTKSAEMEAKRTESGLFHLTSKLTLLQGSTFSTYTCVLFNASGGKEDGTTFEIVQNQEQKGEGPASVSKIVAPLMVIGSLIIGLLLVLLYRKRSKRGHHGVHHGVHTCESDVEEAGDHQEMDEKCEGGLA